MCFAIPHHVINVSGKTVTLDNLQKVRADHDQTVTIGDYVQIQGSLIVQVLTPEEGSSIHQLLKQLNQDILA